MTRIAIAYHSGYGHTQALAEAVAAGAASVQGATAMLIKVDTMQPADWETLAAADAIIFGSPTYMGSVSGPFKQFMDESSRPWYEAEWADKLAAGFTNSASHSGDKLNTLIQMNVLAAQHRMIWVSLGLPPGNNSKEGSPEDLNRIGSYLGAMAQSNADAGPEEAPPNSDRRTAEHLGRRVALAAQRWNRGARAA